MNLPKFLSAIFAVLIGLSASAQKHYEANITIGGKAGATMSRISFSPSVPQSMLNGIMMGVTFRYIEERNFGLIAEVNVEQRGWKEKFEETPYQYQRKDRWPIRKVARLYNEVRPSFQTPLSYQKSLQLQ